MSEEDTVTVGQDLVKIELGGAPEGGKKEESSEKPKEAEKESASAPAEAEKPAEAEPAEAEPKKAAPPPTEKPKETPKAESKPQPAAQPALGSREERRVGHKVMMTICKLTVGESRSK